MKKIDYKTKDRTELFKGIAEAQEKLRLFRFGGAGGHSKNVREGRKVRRDVARMMTVLSATK